ncbi:MAG: response regulator transcription factor [Rhodospirillales bacterium]|nr:response regulator transcription factor [Alphaproteobacteria bacterium]MBL6947430.1 response regulator transcription factor [Rhodospirillales bacterium]
MSTPEHTILIVEDDEMVQAFLALHLENEGYDVFTAATGAQMISILSDEAPDLILLDLNLPDGDGLSLLQAVRKHLNLPIIITSSRGSREDRLMGLGLGADDYITKPFDPKELLLRVKNLLRRALPEDFSPAALLPAPNAEAKVTESLTSGARGGKTLFTPLLAAAGTALLTYWLVVPPETVAFQSAMSPTLEAPAQIAKNGPRFVPAPENTHPQSAEQVAQPEETVNLDAFETAAGIPDNTELEDEIPARPLSELLGHGWAAKSRCKPVPQVNWWRYKTHKDISAYVNRKHGGDWKAYNEIWLKRLAKLQDILERKSSAVTRTGLVLKGDSLNAYIENIQKRIATTHCLAAEAKAHAKGQNVAAQ